MKKRNRKLKINNIFYLLPLIFILFGIGLLSYSTYYYDDPAVSTPQSSEVDDLYEEEASFETIETTTESGPTENPKPTEVTSNLAIHFINVGQGDATLIICDDEAMVIDAGDNSKGSAVWQYLKKLGVEKLKYLILTHPDSDHIGGADVIITKFDIGTVLMPEVSSDTATYRDVISALEYKNYKPYAPLAGEIYNLGSAEFTVIGPTKKYADTNNNSIVIRLLHGENSFLFAGDAEGEAEADMIASGFELGADVYKAGHHGSDTSGLAEFYEQVEPEYVIISCGRDNTYGHPKKELLDRIRLRDIKMFRTDIQGSIIVYSDGERLRFNVAECEDYSPGDYKASEETTGDDLAEVIIPEDTTYVCNRSSKKFHKKTCDAVLDMKEKNRWFTNLTRQELIILGYDPCGGCKP